jgi:hypothetical protein
MHHCRATRHKMNIRPHTLSHRLLEFLVSKFTINHTMNKKKMLLITKNLTFRFSVRFQTIKAYSYYADLIVVNIFKYLFLVEIFLYMSELLISMKICFICCFCNFTFYVRVIKITEKINIMTFISETSFNFCLYLITFRIKFPTL